VIPLHDENPTSTRSWVTIALIVINIAVFVLIQPRDQGSRDVDFAYEYAAVPCEVSEWRPLSRAENPTTNGGVEGVCGPQTAGYDQSCDDVGPRSDCTRFGSKSILLSLVFSMFLHGSWLHLAGNMLFLWVFGNNIEDHLGRWHFTAFYTAAGLVATVAHITLDPSSTVPLIGASGAVAGVMGAYLVWFPNAQVRTLVFFLIVFFVRIRAKWLLGLWFLSQFIIDPNAGVAWMAHVGGFVVGVLVGLAVRESRRARHAMWREQYADDASGLWDNRFGGRGDDPSPSYRPPDFG
jgi:membrane associated rhomboid family serine protease